MTEQIKPVRYGILMGLLGFVFGIGWAIWLVVGHDRIHKSFEIRMMEGKNSHNQVHVVEPEHSPSHTHDEAVLEEMDPSHNEGMGVAEEESHQHEQGADEAKIHFEGGHDSPIMELAHTRLRRGHVHAMGLGLLTIVLSFVLIFTRATDRIKTVTSILTGLGGLIYPVSWIVMGYRTVVLGPNAAQESVSTIAGPGIVLVLFGILTTAFFLVKDIFSKNRSISS